VAKTNQHHNIFPQNNFYPVWKGRCWSSDTLITQRHMQKTGDNSVMAADG